MRELSYRQSTLVCHATGTGKTVVIGALTRLHLMRGGQRVLITAPREELLRQSEEWTKRWRPTADESEWGWEMADRRAHNGNRVILGSLATLRQRRRLVAMPQPDLILHDEAHLDIGMLDTLAGVFPNAKRVGLTATPDRADLQAIMPDPFEAVHPDAIYEIGDAIRDGNLTPIEARRATIEGLDLGAVATGREDFSSGSLSTVMQGSGFLGQTARICTAETEGRQTIVFCCNLDHARKLGRLLNAWGEPGCARIVSGDMSRTDRRQALEEFAAGKYRFILTVVLLSYGWDCPAASCAVMARPTLSRSLWTQCIGRALRLYPGKETALVIDLWGGSESLSLMTPESALKPQFREVGGRSFPGEDPLNQALDALVEISLQRTSEEMLDHAPPEKAYRIDAIANQLGTLGYELQHRDPGEEIASFMRLAELERLGLEGPNELSERQAIEIIDFLAERQRSGLCSLKQALFLQARGFTPAADRELASWAIREIAANGYRVPREVRQHEGLRVTGSNPIGVRS